jgi:nitrite reductase/ring-hydroxylating ferredoxin subunit
LTKPAKVATAEDVPPGTMKRFVVDGKKVTFANIGGKFYAFASVCTHIGGSLLSAALHIYEIHGSVDHVSTAAGARVQYEAGKRLPHIEALERSCEKWGK